MNEEDMKNIGILVSGNGTNMEAIINSCNNGILKDRFNPVIVIANNDRVKAINKCINTDTLIRIIHRGNSKSDYAHDSRIRTLLEEHKVDLVVLAGYNKLLKQYKEGDCILKRFKNRIVNIHPSLLPSFPGNNAIKQALDYGVKITGCTVHFVDKGMDTGKIIRQSSYKILTKDTLETVTEGIHKLEHSLYPEALREIYLQGKI